MARKHVHEDHVNHEAWAIPYGDLVTLLLAFFVVMYAVSSVNEGKYRAVADAMSSAFGGTPRTITPIQLGATQQRGSSFDRPSMQTAAARNGPASVAPINMVKVRQMLDMPSFGRAPNMKSAADTRVANQSDMQRVLRDRNVQLASIGTRIQRALGELMRQKLVTVRRSQTYLEVEIQSDILFASGVAVPSPVATDTLRKLAAVLRDTPNAMRVEGYTDDRPIQTAAYPSNWELSSARAASVVHVLMAEGVAAQRLAVVGYGEHQPIADNATEEGRNANRRVLLVILASPQGPDAVPDSTAATPMDVPAAPDAKPARTEAAPLVVRPPALSPAQTGTPVRTPRVRQTGQVSVQVTPVAGAG